MHNPERWLKVDLIWNRLAPWLARRRGFLAARTLKIGADDEPLRYLQETIPWVKCGPWQDPHDGFAYDEAAARVNWPPLWMISAKADKVLGHPTDVRRFSDEMGSATRHTRFGRDNGNRLDYDHINMLTAPQAQEDHFPRSSTGCSTRRRHDKKQGASSALFHFCLFPDHQFSGGVMPKRNRVAWVVSVSSPTPTTLQSSSSSLRALWIANLAM